MPFLYSTFDKSLNASKQNSISNIKMLGWTSSHPAWYILSLFKKLCFLYCHFGLHVFKLFL